MRRDSIFYKLFALYPTLLFELLDEMPANAANYRFDSVAVKEPKFEIDGVFLPPDNPGIVYFCEVQFQKDEWLYERLFGESFLYFYRNRERFSNWRVVVIYPSRSLEQKDWEPYRELLESPKVRRVYLDELGEFEQLPLGVALMVLTTLEEGQAPERARALLRRSQEVGLSPEAGRAIMEMIGTILVYKFTNLSRREVEMIMGVRFQDTRFYQEAREDERRSLVLLQLEQKFSNLTNEVRSQISDLAPGKLEALAIALLSFSTITNLETWLAENI